MYHKETYEQNAILRMKNDTFKLPNKALQWEILAMLICNETLSRHVREELFLLSL